MNPPLLTTMLACLSLVAVPKVMAAVDVQVPPPVQAVARAMPTREVKILLDVGKDYGLSDDALKLLLVIRKIENGGTGIEMGVGSNIPNHRARRYAGNLDSSLRVQAQWAAGTIRKHYSGDLDAFAKRYCPPKWKHWSGMARWWMDRS